MCKTCKCKKSKPVLKLVNKSPFPTPQYAREGDAGLDLKCILSEPLIIKPHQTLALKTGMYFGLNEGMVGFGKPKSGMLLNHGISCNGVIDSEYTGETHLIITNTSSNNFTLQHGVAYGQIVFMPYISVQFDNVESLEATSRGAGGFGHTGNQ